MPKPAKPVRLSQPNQPQIQSLTNSPQSANPDYVEVLRFLIEPFLESPESLRIDCELHPREPKAWIRMAFDELEKGRVYGRGGRNIQAIRTVLSTVAQTAGQSVHLEIYEDQEETPRPSYPRHSQEYRGNGRPIQNNRPSDNRPRVHRRPGTTPSPIRYRRSQEPGSYS
ncbi:MAG: KH domain-containing protein [Microcoleaceae cyanobacterium]